jgi:hypothetical protein
MTEGKRRPRRPTLRSALAAAKATGRPVKNATVDPDGKITITFSDEPEEATAENPWDQRLAELRTRKNRSK